MEKHDHTGPWAAICICLVLLLIGLYGMLMGSQHQFTVIYDRVGAIQRELECLPIEVFVTDQEGNEYCFDPSEPVEEEEGNGD